LLQLLCALPRCQVSSTACLPVCAPRVHFRKVTVEVAAAVGHGSRVLDSSDEQSSASKGACVTGHSASAPTPVLLLLLLLMLLPLPPLLLMLLYCTDYSTNMLRLRARVHPQTLPATAEDWHVSDLLQDTLGLILSLPSRDRLMTLA
jgi:hypothetical protein